MNGHGRLRFRPRVLVALIVGLVAGPVIVFYLLPHSGLPRAVVSGVVLFMVAKHLGLLAALLGPVYALFRHRSRQ